MKYFILAVTALFSLHYPNNKFENANLNTEDIIALENLNCSNPNLSNLSLRTYYQLGINQLLDTSETKSKEIERLFISIKYYINNDSCLTVRKKDQLISSVDSLWHSFQSFLNNSQSFEYLSYGKGKQAGARAVIHRIYLQEEFIQYLCFWGGGIYYSYLEPGIFNCD